MPFRATRYSRALAIATNEPSERIPRSATPARCCHCSQAIGWAAAIGGKFAAISSASAASLDSHVTRGNTGMVSPAGGGVTLQKPATWPLDRRRDALVRLGRSALLPINLGGFTTPEHRV